MAAVAAASAELLIIGWYIFRVLLQVSLLGFWVGDDSQRVSPKPASSRRDCRLPFRLPRSLPAQVPLCRHRVSPTHSLRRPLSADPPQCVRARLGTKTRGAAGDRCGRSTEAFSDYAVFLECCIYWVGFAFRNPPGTQPIARSEVFRYSLQKLAYTVSRTGRQVLGERRQRAPN
ncbi:neuronatin isoform X1 [Otolemur garnettii]|uniref:neuronatin isoform X1 n=1 Tax=Otolemur garnettii TaxID=30611 RepID=UPI0006442951|nr:neuronatin isoform X1 [Otolemur garnettii]